MAFPDDWDRQCPIDIDDTYIDGDLTNYVLTLNIDNTPSEMYDADGSYPANADGGDIRVAENEDGTTQIACDIYYFNRDNDPANGELECHCKVSSVSSASGKRVWIFYHNTGASMPASDSTYGSENVWTNYNLVVHLGADLDDRTSNGWTGTNNGSAEDTGQSMLGRSSRRFVDTDSDYVDYGTSAGAISGDVDLWVDLFVRFNTWDSGDWYKFVTIGDNQYHLAKHTGSMNFEVMIYDTDWRSLLGNQPSTATWYQFTLRRTASDNNFYQYRNGVSQGSSSSTTIADDTDPLQVGGDSTTSRYSDCWIEEVRIAQYDFGVNYMNATWDNWNIPGTFATEGTPQDVSVGTPITHDNTESTSGASVSSVTLTNFTLGGNSNRLVVVGVTIEHNSGQPSVSGVTFNGVSMTYLEDASVDSSGVYMRVYLYYMLEAQLPTSGDYNIVVTLGGSYQYTTVGAIAAYNVKQGAPDADAENTNTSSDTIQQSITTVTNESWCFDVVGVGNATAFTPDAGQDERYDQATASSQGAGSTKDVATAGATTVGWTNVGANRMALVVACWSPVSVGVASRLVNPRSRLKSLVGGILV